jgi:hypothetical protein
MPAQAYQLRIRNAADTADELVFTSVRGGTGPYIAEPPSGDGQEVDLLTGAVRTGAYQVRVVDAATSTDATGVRRAVSYYLYESYSNPRPVLLSRRAYLEMSTTGAAPFSTVWIGGYITNIVQVDAISYVFTISDSRRVEQTQEIFTWSSKETGTDERTEFPQRGCVFGGPVLGGFGAASGGTNTAVDSGGFEFKYKGFSNGIAAFEYVAGYFPPDFSRKTGYPSNANASALWNAMVGFLKVTGPDKSVTNSSAWDQLRNVNNVFSFPDVIAYIYDPLNTSNTWKGTIRGFLTLKSSMSGGIVAPGTSVSPSYQLYVTFDAASISAGSPTPAMTVDKVYRVRGISRTVTPQAPLYFDLHPVDVVTKLYDIVNIPYKTGASSVANSAAWAKEQLGTTLRLAARITESANMAEFLEKSIFGPFGFATRTNNSGVREFFITRRLSSTAPSVTINTADVRGDTPPAIYALDESAAVTGFSITQQFLSQWVQTQNTPQVPPPDNIMAQAITQNLGFGDTTTFSTRIVSYNVPGMVHDEGTFVPDATTFSAWVAREAETRFARGAPIAEIPILRTSSAASLQIGDEALVNVSYFPNRNYRIGESTAGARCMQVVRRDETPEGPTYKLVDSGVNAQPSVAPTITIAKSTSDPLRVAQFTITNAGGVGGLNTLTAAYVAIEYATGASAPPYDGTPFTTYATPNVPTTAVALPAVIPGSKVWVRARSMQAGIRPSAWTAWTSVTLDAFAAPSNVATDFKSKTYTELTWSLGSPAVTDYLVDVYLYEGASAPSNWTSHRVATVAAGTTRTSFNNLTANTTYVAAVAFRDPTSNTRSAVATLTFTTLSSSYFVGSEPTPFAKFVTGNGYVPALPSGVPMAIYGFAGERYEVQRAPDSAGSPGTYATLEVVDGDTIVNNVYVDSLPIDGTVYWYRVRQLGKLLDNSAWFTIGSTTAVSIPASLFKPQQVAPTISYTIDYQTSSYIVSFNINGEAGGLNNSVAGGGIWSGNLSGSALTWPPDYTTSPQTFSRPTGSSAMYTIGAVRDGLETRAYFEVQGINTVSVFPALGQGSYEGYDPTVDNGT